MRIRKCRTKFDVNIETRKVNRGSGENHPASAPMAVDGVQSSRGETNPNMDTRGKGKSYSKSFRIHRLSAELLPGETNAAKRQRRLMKEKADEAADKMKHVLTLSDREGASCTATAAVDGRIDDPGARTVSLTVDEMNAKLLKTNKELERAREHKRQTQAQLQTTQSELTLVRETLSHELNVNHLSRETLRKRIKELEEEVADLQDEVTGLSDAFTSLYKSVPPIIKAVARGGEAIRLELPLYYKKTQ